MKDIIAQLDSEILRKQPPGIKVSRPLFNALKESGRIVIKPLTGPVFPVLPREMLDGKVEVTIAEDLPEIKHFRLPPICHQD